MESAYTSTSTKPIFRGTQAVWYILGVIEVFLAFRFALRLLGANPGAAFTDLIYSVSYVFAAPFIAVFNSTRIIEGSVFEWTTILAMFVYWVLAVGIIRLLRISKPVSTPEAASKLEHHEKI